MPGGVPRKPPTGPRPGPARTPCGASCSASNGSNSTPSALAAAQQTAAKPVRRPPLAVRLSDNEAVLRSAYRSIARAVGEGRAITPAAEWLLDNYHLVQDQIREIREDLPPGFYRQLPKLADGPFSGYPRVFGIAWAFVAHTDSHFEPEALRRFVRAYQTVQPLGIGELWAVAITLRIVLVENLRRAAQRILSSREARQDADELADRLLAVNGDAVDPAVLLQRYDDDEALHKAFVVQLVQRLRDQDPRITPALTWLEERLAAEGTTAEAVVRDEHQRQAGSNVTVRNIITSMRLISELEWSGLLRERQPGRRGAGSRQRLQASMDFATRNLYRSRIEELARGSKLTELEIAAAAIASLEKTATGAAGRERRPGLPPDRGRPAGLRIRPSATGPRCGVGRCQWLARRGAVPYLGANLPDLVPDPRPCRCSGWDDQGLAGPALLLLGLLGLLPATGRRRCPGQPGGDPRRPRHHPARTGASRRRAAGAAGHWWPSRSC